MSYKLRWPICFLSLKHVNDVLNCIFLIEWVEQKSVFPYYFWILDVPLLFEEWKSWIEDRSRELKVNPRLRLIGCFLFCIGEHAMRTIALALTFRVHKLNQSQMPSFLGMQSPTYESAPSPLATGFPNSKSLIPNFNLEIFRAHWVWLHRLGWKWAESISRSSKLNSKLRLTPIILFPSIAS